MSKGSTIDDFIAKLELERDLDDSEADFEAGRFHTQEEVKKMVAEWSKSYALRADKSAARRNARE